MSVRFSNRQLMLIENVSWLSLFAAPIVALKTNIMVFSFHIFDHFISFGSLIRSGMVDEGVISRFEFYIYVLFVILTPIYYFYGDAFVEMMFERQRRAGRKDPNLKGAIKLSSIFFCGGVLGGSLIPYIPGFGATKFLNLTMFVFGCGCLCFMQLVAFFRAEFQLKNLQR